MESGQGLLFCRHPNDLVVQHKEQVMFTNPNTGKYQLSGEHRMCTTIPVLIAYAKNFHHLLLSYAPIQHCRINRDTFTMFTKVHKNFIAMEFGLRAAVV